MNWKSSYNSFITFSTFILLKKSKNTHSKERTFRRTCQEALLIFLFWKNIRFFFSADTLFMLMLHRKQTSLSGFFGKVPCEKENYKESHRVSPGCSQVYHYSSLQKIPLWRMIVISKVHIVWNSTFDWFPLAQGEWQLEDYQFVFFLFVFFSSLLCPQVIFML